MNKQILKSTLIAAAGLLFANSAMAAGTDTATFQVTATVADSCLVSATPLAFGAYNPAAVKDGTSTITVTCTAKTPYEIGLDAGSGTPVVTTRAMTGSDGASTQLDYELYTETGPTNVRGAISGTGTTVTQSALTGGPLDYTVYGQIPASQYVPAASYLDTITVTVAY